MRLLKKIDREGNGAPNLQKFAYLFHVDDIYKWFPPAEGEVFLSYAPKMRKETVVYRLYITPGSQDFGADSAGNHDEQYFRSKFSGTHPGCFETGLMFAQNMNDEGFVIMIPQCGDQTLILGIPDNPLFLTSSHKGDKSGRKFTFSFEQKIESEELYYLAHFKPWENSEFRFFDKMFNKNFA